MPKKIIVVEGDNVQAAIKEGLTRLGKEKNEVEVKILQEEQPGLFAENAAPARVQLTAKGTDIEGLIHDLVDDMLDLLGHSDYSLEITTGDNNYLVKITTQGSVEEIIGPDGKTLNAIQSLVEEQISLHSSEPLEVIIDAGQYRKDREIKLKKMARLIAEQVKREKQEVELQPMIKLERYFIHKVVDNIEDVKAHSIGEGENRRIVILPKGKS